MKLIYQILVRLFLALTVILAAWGFFFYITIIDEINDEVDDSLEDYSENIITRALAGHNLPSQSDGTNNTYFLKEITKEEAKEKPHLRYSDEDVYIVEKEEKEPARILVTIFKDQEGRYFELTVSTPTIEKEDLQDAILNWIIILYVTLFISLLTINIWIYHNSMKPLYILLKWMDHYTIGKEIPLPELKTGITEFRKLHDAANRSVERNQAIFEQQKQFIGNASHELQTPLAICQNRLEMLAENESMTEELLTEITKVQETLNYIIRLNKSLLLLSKIENGQFRDDQLLCLNDLIRRQLEDYQEIYSHKEITVEVEEQGKLEINMSPTLATALITNLLKNAYTHNQAPGKIQITITPHSLTFSNTGASERLDDEKIFHRFYQGQNSGQGSSGLGLSIAKAICNLYHLRLEYSYDGVHHFKLTTPTKTIPF